MINNRKYYIPFLLIGLFYFPFIINNQLYVDDVFRAHNGFDGWTQSGRPLADMVMHLVMMSNSKLPGYGVLGQILSVAIMSATAIFYAKNALLDSSSISLIAASGFALSPFYIENMLYQYDNLPMTLSLCGAIVASVLSSKDGTSNFILSIIIVAACSALYQAAINSYIAFVSVNAIIKLYQSESPAMRTLMLSLRGVFVLILGMVLYTMIIKLLFPMTGSRGQEFSIEPSLMNFFIKRMVIFYGLIWSTMSSYYVYFCIALISITALTARKKMSFPHILIFILCVFVISLSPIGILAVFGEDAIAARMMMGSVGILSLTLIMVSISKNNIKLKYTAVLLILLPIYVVSYGLSFAIKEQRNYENAIVAMAVNDIRKNNDYNDSSKIIFSGRAPVAPLAVNTANNFPLIAIMLVPAYDWTASLMAQSIDVPNVMFEFSRKDQKVISKAICSKNDLPIAGTYGYSVYKDNISNSFLIWLKGGKKHPC